MANEIRTQISLTVSNGTYIPPTWNESGSFTMNAIDAQGGVVNCTTAMADIPLGNVSTVGWSMVKNLDAAANIDLGYDDSSTFRGTLTLKPGESALFRWKSGVVPACKAQSGTPKLQYVLYQD